jgi:O-Antigen ligase
MELLLALFMTSGPIKAFFEYYRVPFPIDFTVLCAALIVVMLIFQTIFRFSPPKPTSRFTYCLSILLVFYAWMLVSMFYSVSPKYSQEKVILFVNTMLAFCVPILTKDFSALKLIKWFMILGYPMTLLFSISMYLNYVATYNTVFLGFHANYLPLSEQVGLGIITIASAPQSIKRDWLRLVVIITGYVLILLTGARGPLIFLILCHLIVFSIQTGKIKNLTKPSFIIQTSIGLVLAFFVGGVLFSIYPDQVGKLVGRTTERFILLVADDRESGGGGGGQSAGVRIHLFEKTIDMIAEDPGSFILGKGIGSYGLLYLGRDERYYPHHIFLEVLVEMGVIGLLLYCLFLFMVLTYRSRNGIIYRIPIFFLVLNCLKSHTVVDLRVLFACLGVYLLPRRDRALAPSGLQIINR